MENSPFGANGEIETIYLHYKIPPRLYQRSHTWSGTMLATLRMHALLNAKLLVIMLLGWSMVRNAVSLSLRNGTMKIMLTFTVVCGDVENIQVASAPGVSTSPLDVQNYIRSAVPQIVPDSQCNSVCAGNSSYLCGSGNLMAYYAWNGSEPLYDFNFPTGTAAGDYSLLIGGVVVPLIVSQVVTGKVTFVEKYGSGEPNGTGAYELDLSQIDNFSSAWRAMTGFQTDVFCAAGLTLPDKAGRQITVGGWAGASNFGVRLYWPDGSDGVPGTHEWEEDQGVISLQVPRWYASAMIMANGSMLSKSHRCPALFKVPEVCWNIKT